MRNSDQARDSKKSASYPKSDVRIRDNAPDLQAALPEGTQKGPFLDRQGDEQRQPSGQEQRELAEIQKAERARQGVISSVGPIAILPRSSSRSQVAKRRVGPEARVTCCALLLSGCKRSIGVAPSGLALGLPLVLRDG